MTKRIKVTSKVDRDHFTYDVLSVFRKHGRGIIWMEAHTKYLFVKCNDMDESLWQSILEEIESVDDCASVEQVDLMGLEENAIEMDAIMDSSDKAFIILRPNGSIKYLNLAATRILTMERKDVLNRVITDIFEDEILKKVFRDHPENYSSQVDIMYKGRFFIGKINSIMSEESTLTAYYLELDDVSRMSMLVNELKYDSSISFDDIIYKSEAMAKTIERAKRYAMTDSVVLITGESGTGKELFTRSIHNMSPRRRGPFIAINCASLPEQLLESELFGYTEGSFTGGRRGGKPGILEMANGGTVFLDEIGEMAPHLQSKLLRVIQEMKVRRIGSGTEVPINVRFLSATNKNLDELVRKEKFRLDLLYRINTLNLRIPPLRDRKEDIEPLVNFFVASHAMRYEKPIKSITRAAVTKLQSYDWPGNVRELQNVVERAVALVNGEIIDESVIVIDSYGSSSFDLSKSDFQEKVKEFEISLIQAALSDSQSIREAAKSLNITHTMLINRMKKYNLVKV